VPQDVFQGCFAARDHVLGLFQRNLRHDFMGNSMTADFESFTVQRSEIVMTERRISVERLDRNIKGSPHLMSGKQIGNPKVADVTIAPADRNASDFGLG